MIIVFSVGAEQENLSKSSDPRECEAMVLVRDKSSLRLEVWLEIQLRSQGI